MYCDLKATPGQQLLGEITRKRDKWFLIPLMLKSVGLFYNLNVVFVTKHKLWEAVPHYCDAYLVYIQHLLVPRRTSSWRILGLSKWPGIGSQSASMSWDQSF